MGIKREASQSSSSSSHPRRKSNTGNNEIPRVDEDLRQPKVFEINASDLAAVVLVKPEPTDRQRDTWTRILPEAKAQCVKAVVRLLVMKGARKEPVSRSHISDCLGKVDSTYKKHIDVVIVESQSILEDVFGYTLITGDEVRGLGGKKDEVGGAEGKKDEFFIFNILKSPRMLSSLSELADDEAAFTGFCYVIFQILLTSPGKAADAKTVLQKLRKVDSRFPETLLGRPKSSSASNKANPVPELKDDFLGLMGQMKKRGYVIAVKNEREPDDPGKVVYSLGVRFAVDLGKRRLIRAHYATNGQDMDKSVLKDIVEEEEAEELRRKPAEEEEENE